ncbi:VOC family protein [Alphaproteobacteria bacterium]|jgi:lactoylglutathione lyase|nr:VOC family protein [Alphaproteobacteria bacterium]
MKYLHTMIRVSNLDATINFFVSNFGMVETRRIDSEKGRFTIVFLAASEDVENANTHQSPVLELTHNWDPEEYTGGRNFGHLAYAVDNIYESCQTLMDNSVTINRPPRDGRMAFIQTPDGISIELLQKGDSLPKQEPWASMENTGNW